MMHIYFMASYYSILLVHVRMHLLTSVNADKKLKESKITRRANALSTYNILMHNLIK